MGASAPLILTGSTPADFTGLTTVSKPNDFGIRVSAASAFVTVVRNFVSMNLVYGIHLDTSGNLIVSGNNVSDNGEGIRVDTVADSSLSGNSVEKNVQGIRLRQSSSISVVSNVVSMNSEIGAELLDSSGISLHHNVFIDNPSQARDQGG